jgi:hypothetical protein
MWIRAVMPKALRTRWLSRPGLAHGQEGADTRERITHSSPTPHEIHGWETGDNESAREVHRGTARVVMPGGVSDGPANEGSPASQGVFSLTAFSSL